MTEIDKKEVARILNEIGTMLELKGENPFKSRAYYNGARSIESITEDIQTLVESGKLAGMKGIGQALHEKITELVTEGELVYYEDLKSSIPEGLLDMLDIPGLGPKKVRKIWQELEISTIGELEYACQENRLTDLEGFGQKTQEKVLDGIEYLKKYQDRWLLDDAYKAADPLLKYVDSHDKVNRAQLAGSLRRMKETVKDVDILASVAEEDRQSVMNDFSKHEMVAEVIGSGETRTSVRLKSGIQADLRLVSDEEFPFALHYFTGSKEHNTAMRSIARKQEIKMNEYGLFTPNEERITCADEAEIFKSLGLNYIPPGLRENMGEIEYASDSPIPALLTERDIRGIIHIHTNYSDGVPSIRNWVEECRNRGYSYLGITDHSQSAFYANGLKPDRLAEQWEEIEEVGSDYPDFRIFQGIESDILPDGSLDYEDDILEQFDFVIASVHSHFQLSRSQQTERLIRAVKNPYTTILGHPTGRLLLAREEYAVDMPAVIRAAGGAGTVIEINANPRRLDLDWRLGPLAREQGVLTAINPDAHSFKGLDYMRYGVGVARKGWFQADEVINTWHADRLAEFFKERRLSKEPT